MITAKHLRPYQISIEGADKISSEDNERLSASQILEGDVVVVRVGYPGDSAVVPKSLSGINCASLLIVRKPEGIRSEFLCHALNSFIGRTQIDLSQYGSAQKVCNVGDLKEFLIPVPARIEQEAIIAFLDSKTNEIATLIEKAERAIALLTEYRTALITEAVTGRVEVRYSNAITPYTKDINNGTV